MTLMETSTTFHTRLVEEHSAHNYHPLPVVVAHAEGAWVTDVEGRRYLDCLAGYSALNFGHRHPDLVAAAHRQLDRVTLTSRAFGNDQLGPFCAELAELLGKQMVLPMNTGAEAVESGIKVVAQVGLRGEGRARGPGPDHRRGRGLPRPHDDDRRLLHRPGRARRLRPVHPRLRRRALRRPRRPAGRGHARHRRRAGRADPGRGRRGRPACRLPGRGAGDLRRPPACCSWPTRCSPGSGAPGTCWRRGPRASTPTSTCSARRSAAASCRCRPSSRTPTCSACCGRASTAARSAATRSPARSAGR